VLDLPEIPARVNVNTAPREVLLALPGLSEPDVDKILEKRPKLSATEAPPDIYQTQAWLLTEGVLNLSTLQSVDQYLGGMSQVYRVQSVGYLEGKGPSVRVEAIIDTNAGRPRIVAWRDLSELGKGWNEPQRNNGR
jgi:type II secretory pathway component PulK